MPISTVDHARHRKKPNNNIQDLHFSSTNGSIESTSCFGTKPKNKKTMSMSFRGLGCKGMSSPPVSAPAVIRSAAQWQNTKQMRRSTRRNKTTLSSSTRNLANVVDIPDVCCAPPGIGSASDVAPRLRTATPRSNNREHSRVARRAANDEETSRLHTSNIRHQCSRSHHRPPIMILRQNLQFARDLGGEDQYGSLRLDVDAMSYEQLVELSDRIGYVGSGLAKEKIAQHMRKFKLSTTDSTPLLMSTDKAWRCTICQEGYKVDDEIGKLECGHYHHIDCIKQWLLLKNACPVCKSAAVHEN